MAEDRTQTDPLAPIDEAEDVAEDTDGEDVSADDDAAEEDAADAQDAATDDSGDDGDAATGDDGAESAEDDKPEPMKQVTVVVGTVYATVKGVRKGYEPGKKLKLPASEAKRLIRKGTCK